MPSDSHALTATFKLISSSFRPRAPMPFTSDRTRSCWPPFAHAAIAVVMLPATATGFQQYHRRLRHGQPTSSQ